MNRASTVSSPARVLVVLRRARGRLAQWLRPPRRLRFTRWGGLLTGTIMALGFAALNTANNLLYLVLGGLLGLIVVSGWLSEQVLRRLSVERRLPRAGVAGQPVRASYDITNHKTRFPSLALELRDATLGSAYLISVWPGKTGSARAETTIGRRGVYALDRLVLRTSFPFGLFIKERDISVPAMLTIWPRVDRMVRTLRRAGGRAHHSAVTASVGARGGRGEYRSLRPYLPGDDPRDVHWRSSARRRQPLVREYELDSSQTFWLCLDLRAPEGDQAELLVEIAAALAARAVHANQRFGLATNESRVDPGTGPGQLEMVLDLLARVRFRVDAPLFRAPADPSQCVLVTVAGAPADYADVFTTADA
ncbi:MAG: DUF58 domain-containing protein [Longimicrobiales bacterium]